MSSEIQLYEKMQDPILAIERLGSMMAKSGLSGAEKTETGMMLAWACMAERKSPFEIFRTYHLVEGKLAMRSDAMLAGFRQRGGKVKWTQFDATAAIGVFSFEGTDTEVGFTMEDAKRMEVVRPRSGWTKAPDAMLRARCIGKAIRMLCPEVISGYLSVEEITDNPDDAPQKEIVLPKSSVDPDDNYTAPKRGPGRPSKQPYAPIDVLASPIPTLVTEPPKTIPVEPEKNPEPCASPVSDEGFTVIAGNDGGINNETVSHLLRLFGTDEAAAFAWLKNKPHWFVAQKSDNLSALLAAKAQMIIDKYPAFLKQLNTKQK